MKPSLFNLPLIPLLLFCSSVWSPFTFAEQPLGQPVKIDPAQSRLSFKLSKSCPKISSACAYYLNGSNLEGSFLSVQVNFADESLFELAKGLYEQGVGVMYLTRTQVQYLDKLTQEENYKNQVIDWLSRL